ncbi:MAG: PASTA domain-containing protein [Bacteroidales bacterium]|nr:PASTA domain-containing protein [Bacteroidales bacterium]
MEKIKEKAAGKGEKMLRKNFLAGIIFVIMLLILASLGLRTCTRHNKELTVPDFKTLSLADARALAAKNDLRLDVVDSVYVKRLAHGAVYRQNPEAGAAVKKGRRILITINSMTPQMTSVPNVVGYSLRQASAELASRGLTIGELIYRTDMATNNVLEQRYRGRQVIPGSQVETESAIDLVLGLNPSDNITYVPYVVGYTAQLAANSINDNSLNVGLVKYDDTVKDYRDSLSAVVYRQSPMPQVSTNEEGEASVVGARGVVMGSKVDIYLTIDPDKVVAR